MKKLITIFILILLMTLGGCNLTPKKYEKEVRETIDSYIPTLKDTINVEYHYIDSLKRYQSDNNKTVYSYLNYQEEMLKEEFIYNDNIESSRKYIFKNGSYQLESEEDKLISLDEYKDKHQFFNFDNLDFNKAKYTYKVTNRLSSQPSRDILFNFDKNLEFEFKYLNELIVIHNLVVNVELVNPEINKDLMTIKLNGLNNEKENILFIVSNVL